MKDRNEIIKFIARKNKKDASKNGWGWIEGTQIFLIYFAEIHMDVLRK